MKRKFFSILALLVATVIGGANVWAETGTETESDRTGGNASNADAVGTSYTVAGTYIAGSGSVKADPMPNKGVKFRTGQNSNTLEFTVTAEYTITKLELVGLANYAKNDGVADDAACISVTKVEVDGTEVTFAGGQFPDKAATAAATLTVDNIAAKEKIVITFDNSNAKGKQINATYTINWSKAAAHTHSYATEWSSDANGHWHVCKGEGECDALKADSAAHVFGTEGIANYTCTVCSYVDADKKSAYEAEREEIANTDFSVTLKDGVKDAENWVITPASAKPGTVVTFKYKGAKQIKSIKVVKKKAAQSTEE